MSYLRKIKNWAAEPKNAHYINKVKVTAKAVKEISAAGEKVRKKVSVSNVSALVHAVAESVTEDQKPSTVLGPKTTKLELNYNTVDIISNILQTHPLFKEFPRKQGSSEKIYSVKITDDIELVIDEPNVLLHNAREKIPYEKAEELLKQECWKLLGIRAVLTRSKTSYSIALSPHKLYESYPSRKANRILERVAKFNDRGEGRAILLYGPPGTGKTSMANYIAESIKGTTLVIERSALVTNPYAISNVIGTLRPEIVIIDDFDRVKENSDSLETLSTINSTCKLLLATINCKEKLDPAVTRAGRFDEQIPINEVVPAQSMCPQITDEKLLEELGTWPAAFIKEFGKRIEVLGMEQAMSELDGLRKRVEENKKVKNDSSHERLKDLVGL